jgi:hypothetical protein
MPSHKNAHFWGAPPIIQMKIWVIHDQASVTDEFLLCVTAQPPTNIEIGLEIQHSSDVRRSTNTAAVGARVIYFHSFDEGTIEHHWCFVQGYMYNPTSASMYRRLNCTSWWAEFCSIISCIFFMSNMAKLTCISSATILFGATGHCCCNRSPSRKLRTNQQRGYSILRKYERVSAFGWFAPIILTNYKMCLHRNLALDRRRGSGQNL